MEKSTCALETGSAVEVVPEFVRQKPRPMSREMQMILDDLKPDLGLKIVFKEKGLPQLDKLRIQVKDFFVEVGDDTYHSITLACETQRWADGIASRTFCISFNWDYSDLEDDYFLRFAEWFEKEVALGVDSLEPLYD